MIRNLLAGVAALALMTGAAYAQDSNYYSDTRSVTSTTPFGSSRTVTTTTSRSLAPAGDDVDAAQMPPPPPVGYDEQSADISDSDAPPPPTYRRETTTRQFDPYGNEVDRTDTVQKRQSFYDGDGELSAHTTTQTQSRVTTYGPPVVYRPSAVVAGPSPSMDLPPYQRTMTTTITDDGD